MASETVVSHPTTIDEQVEEKLKEELKKVDQESVSQLKESGEENTKSEELSSSTAPLSKTEEKTKDKLIEESPCPEPPLSKTEEKTEDKLIDESPSLVAPLPEPEEKTQDKNIEESPCSEPPLSKTEEKTEDKLIDESPSLAAPLPEPEEKTEDKNIEESPCSEPPLSKTEEKTEEKLTDESPSLAAPLSEPEEKTEDKQIEPPVLEEVVKIDDTTVEDVPVKENFEVAQEPISDELGSESVEKEQKEQPEMESVKKQTGERPEMANVPESSIEVLEKQEEPLEVSPVKEYEAIAVKEREDSEVEKPVTVDVPESPVEVLEKQEEPLEVSPVKEPEGIAVTERKDSEAEKSVAVDVLESSVEKKEEPLEVSPAKELEAIAVTEREDSEAEKPVTDDVPESSVEVFVKKEEPLEVSPLRELEAITVTEREDSEAEITKVEKPEPAIPRREEKPEEQPGVTEQVEKKCEEVEPEASVAGETVKEEETLVDKVKDTMILEKEKTSEGQELFASENSDPVVSINKAAQADLKGDVVVEKAGLENIEKEASVANVVGELAKEVGVGKIDEENEAKDLSKEGNEEKSVITDMSAQPPRVEDVNSSISTSEVIEKSFEGEKTSRDVELVAQNKIEEDMKGKLDENITTFQEQLGEAQESKLEVKGEETVKADVDESEKERDEETVKSDATNLNPSMVVDDTKTSQDRPKEVSAKPTQKQSNNILTKVKKTLVKAKKAIIGKSPSSKTLSTETKGDIEVK